MKLRDPRLDVLLDAIKSGLVADLTEDMTSLPVYGGPEPQNTSGVWSWDRTRMIVGTCPDDMRIEGRDDVVSADLLPCPFCGASDSVGIREALEDEALEDYAVVCSDCAVVCSFLLGGCGGSGAWAKTASGATAAWNKRVNG